LSDYLKNKKEVGIISSGAYVPWHRLKRDEVGKIWELPGRGEKAVANYDEDTLTMAVEASRNNNISNSLLNDTDLLYFCSTTPPYLEKQNSATIAEVLQLPETTQTVDVTNSLRAGTQGLIMATDAILAGRAKAAIVCASDKRLGLPNGTNEMAFGDGAAAFYVGTEDIIAIIRGTYTIRQEIISTWRSDRDRFVRSFEERFGLEMGYNRIIPNAVKLALSKEALSTDDISKMIIYSANPRHIKGVVSKLGFNSQTQIQDGLFEKIGNLGTAQVPLNLTAALEQSNSGDLILVVNYSDGCDVILLEVTKNIEKLKKKRRKVPHYLKNKRLLSYVKYMSWREMLPLEPPARAKPETPSASALWRDNKSLALIGVKCQMCGTIQYPPFRICIECNAKDNFEPYRLAEKRGTLVSYSHDNLAASQDKPTTIAVVDFEEGGRIMCDITDREPDEIQIGMPVEMTFRIMRYEGGIYDYWWKCKPFR
jgi:3-hydroxy-3-methylglutaryl CoA synthase